MSDNSLEKILADITSNKELMDKISTTVNNGSGDMENTLSSVISLISNSSFNNKSSNTQDINTNGEAEENKEKSYEKSDTPPQKIIEEEKIFDKNQLSFLGSFANSISKNSDFLLALKPYLNKERKDIIDNVVRISRLASIMNLAK